MRGNVFFGKRFAKPELQILVQDFSLHLARDAEKDEGERAAKVADIGHTIVFQQVLDFLCLDLKKLTPAS